MAGSKSVSIQKLFIWIISVCFATVFFTVSTYAGDVVAINSKSAFNSAAIKGFDPVAYWVQGKPVKGDKALAVEWRGATWRFSSAKNRGLFKANPAKYAPQYGGYCAWAMAGRLISTLKPGIYTRANFTLTTILKCGRSG